MIDMEKVKSSKLRISTMKKQAFDTELEELTVLYNEDGNQYITSAREKSTSAWFGIITPD